MVNPTAIDQDYNPRFLCFCKAHNLEPDDAQERWNDREPGKLSIGYQFSFWIRDCWREWERETGWNKFGYDEEDHASFDAWLHKKVGL